MFLEVYDTDNLAGEVWLLNIYFAQHDAADSSKPDKLRKCIHHKIHVAESHHSKTENLQYQNQSHRVCLKFYKKQIHLQ